MTPIREFSLERDGYALFATWLQGFFDGNSHAIGGNDPVPFPKVALSFAQSQLPQPLNPVNPVAGQPVAPVFGLTMVLADGDIKATSRWELVGGRRQRMNYKKVRWNFWIRTAAADASDRALGLQAGDLLTGILGNAKATQPLADNGVHRIRPGTIKPVADTGYILRLLTCGATLRYAVRSQV